MLRTFAAEHGTANSVSGLKWTSWWTRKLPLSATLTARMPEVTRVSEIFTRDRFEYITHGLRYLRLEAEPSEDGSASRWITWPLGQSSISEFFAVNIKSGHDTNEDSALFDLSMLH
jgi:hypothetical protein